MSDHPIDREDITALRKEGDLKAYIRGLIAPSPTRPAGKPPPKKRARRPPYHIPRPGAWPCGTAASGPTPDPCDDCQPTTATASHRDQPTGDTT